MSRDHQSIIDKVRSVPKLIFTDDFELTIQEKHASSIHYTNGDLTTKESDESLWIGLRLQHQKRPGRASTFYSDDASLVNLVESAFEASRHSSPDPWFRFPIWRPRQEPIASTEGPNLPDSVYPHLTWRPERIEEHYEESRVKTTLFRKCEKRILQTHHAEESANFFAMERSAETGLSMTAQRRAARGKLERDRCLDELIRGVYFRNGGSLFSVDKDTPLVLGTQVVAQIFEKIGGWFSAEKIQKGLSPLCGKMGETVFSPVITLVDEPGHERSSAAAEIDLEGSPTQRNVLVSKGVVTGFLYDVYTAMRENRLSTGNRRRLSDRAEPEIAPWHLVCSAGEEKLEGLFREMKDGVYIDYCSRLEEDPTHPTRLGFHGLGWRVAGGTIQEPIWHIRFHADIFDLLRRVVKVTKTQTFFGGISVPSMLVEHMPLEK